MIEFVIVASVSAFGAVIFVILIWGVLYPLFAKGLDTPIPYDEEIEKFMKEPYEKDLR